MKVPRTFFSLGSGHAERWDIAAIGALSVLKSTLGGRLGRTPFNESFSSLETLAVSNGTGLEKFNASNVSTTGAMFSSRKPKADKEGVSPSCMYQEGKEMAS